MGSLLALFIASPARPDATYQSLPFAQNWTNTGLITAADNWSGVPGVVGFRGDGLAVGGADPQTVVANDSPGVIDVNANQSSPTGFATGGVTEFQVTDPAVAIAGSATAAAPYVVFHVNAIGRFNIQVAYKLRDLENTGSVDNAVMPVALQFRTSAANTWTNVAAGFVADATDPPSNAKETLVSVFLPAAANYAPTLQIRVITTNAAGNDEWVGIDDVSITGTTEPFADVTVAAMVSTNASTGVAWGDYDGDGDLDLFQTKFSGSANKLFRLDAGTWVDGTPAGLAVAGDGRGAVTADYDNDGDLDLYVANYSGGSNRLYRNDAGIWVNATSGAAGGTYGTQNAAWGDFDGDRDLDLYLQNQGAKKLIRNDAGTWVDATAGALVSTSVGTGVTTGDFDNDGDLDIFICNQGASNKLLRNDAGTWVDATTAPINFSGGSNGVAAGDFDNDGDLDLYVTTINGQTNRLYRNDLGSWADITSGPIGVSLACNGVTAADFDNDGDLDLYVSLSASANKLFRNDAGTWVDATGTVAANASQSQGVAAGDYDGDGDLDLYLVNNTASPKLYRNENANGNHWLQVKLAGTLSNRSAIGARVRVVAGGVARIREIEGGSGMYGQNSLAAEFGLGAATTIDSVIVRWPNGPIQVVTPPAVDQAITVTEPLPLFADATPPAMAIGLEALAWGDYDADGDFDLYGSSLGAANKLFRNDGATWVDATTGPLNDPGRGIGVAWGDADHDGDLDLYLCNDNLGSGEANKLFRNDAGSFVNATNGALGFMGRNFIAPWVDIENDGDLDLYVPGTTTPSRLIRNDGGTWVDATSGALAGPGGGVAWGDYDGDGDLDAYIAAYSPSPNRLVRNDAASWVDVTSGPLGNTGNSNGVAWGDYDNDGDLDLYLTNSGSANHLFRNDAGTWVDATSGPLGYVGSSYGPAWADYDNDGDLDLYIVNVNSTSRLFRNDVGTWADVTSGPIGVTGFSTGAAWADADLDGDLDLFVANAATSRLLRNENANGNHWLHVKLVGTASNGSGIGARVRVVAGGVRRIQEISGGSGASSQNSLPAEFGLGTTTTIDSLVIRWPSGIVQSVTPPAVDQAISVTEMGASSFVDVATAPINETAAGSGVAWGDYDNDGDFDLYQAKTTGPNRLYRQDTGNWVNATSGPLGDTGQSHGVASGDYDNDGDLDLYVVNDGSSSKLLRNDAGAWVDATSGAAAQTGTGMTAVWGDFDRDGDLDLYYVSTSANKMIRNDAGTWADATTGPLGNASFGQGAVAADFDRDGDLDLFLCNDAVNASKLLRNDPGTWIDFTSGPLNVSFAHGAAAADYDNDGDLDLFVTTGSGISNKLLRNDGASWADVTSGPLGDTSNCFGVAWADIDNDRDPDLFVTRQAQAPRLYRNDGGSWVDATPPSMSPSVSSAGAAWADYDRDGDVDLYVSNSGNPNQLFRNESPHENASDNRWIQLQLEGTISNRSAIGARVEVQVGGLSMVQEVSGGSGYQSQNSLTVEFGLGNYDVDSVIVRWPSGIVQAVPIPYVNAIYRVGENVPTFHDATGYDLHGDIDGRGMAWGDFDNDGDPDLYVTVDAPGTHRLIRNDGGDLWSDMVTSGAEFSSGGISSGRSAAWGDFDNDGDLDLYVVTPAGQPNRLYRNDAATFVDVATGALADITNGKGATWLDFDRDGDLDLLVLTSPTSRLLRNDAGSWVNVTPAALAVSANGAAVGDIDDDGDLDVYLTRDGANRLVRNDTTSWVDITNGPLGFFASSQVGSFADCDNDGDLDLYVSVSAGAHHLFRNDSGTWVDVTRGQLITSGTSIAAAWGDYDNDGDLDLFSDVLYRNNNDGTWTDGSNGDLFDFGVGRGAGWADYDGDGDLDLYSAYNFGYLNQLYRNDQTSGRHWLQAKLVGTSSNRSAVGARVKLVAGGRSQRRDVGSEGGYLSQGTLDVEFGLGATTLIDSIVIHWPSGIVWDSTNVAIDQKMTLIEHYRATAGVGPGAAVPRTLELSTGTPNPFEGHTRFEYALPTATHVRITVHDLQGRQVAILANRVHAPGRHSAIWDGRDAGGTHARAGVYFVKLETTAGGGGTRLRKIVMTL